MSEDEMVLPPWMMRNFRKSRIQVNKKIDIFGLPGAIAAFLAALWI